MNNKQKKNNQRLESSLLLQPDSFMTWSNVPGNSLYMPIAVETPFVNMKENTEEQKIRDTTVLKSNESFLTPGSSNEMLVPETASVTQLQQPLMFCKSTSPVLETEFNTTSIPSSSLQPSMVSAPTDFPNTSQCSSNLQYAVSPNSQSQNLEIHQYYDPLTLPNANCVQPVSISTQHESPDNKRTHSYSAESSLPNNSTEATSSYVAESFAYRATQPYWFYMKIVEQKEMWYGFSSDDSKKIEYSYQKASNENIFEDVIVPVDGGRYDIYLLEREKRAVYWEEKPHHVRRCMWFQKAEVSQRFLPYDESTSYLIEELYHKCSVSGKWQQKLILEGGEVIMMEGPHTILHYAHGLDAWPTVTDSKANPKIVIRGVPDGMIFSSNETSKVDHLIFVVQGIGSFCDLSFRTVYQCVDGFREIANSMLHNHFKHELESKIIGRIEFIPLAWHSSLHTDDVGFDRQMKGITLPSIPKLRYFTNDTLLDILLYSSPMYCQAIIDTVTSGLNRLYSLFLFRNPDFNGQVSVAGHSLGSLILFDILANQSCGMIESVKQENNELQDIKLSNFACDDDSRRSSIDSSSNHDKKKIHSKSLQSVLEDLALEEYLEEFLKEKIDLETLMFCGENELKDLGLPMGPRKKLLEFIKTYKTAAPGLVHSNDAAINTEMSATVSNKSVLGGRFAAHSLPCVYPLSSPDSSTLSVTFQNLDFHPSCFFALGSPISMFLAVRGFSTISEEFHFPTCRNFFHIFHPYDPVAFRIETLIDPKFCGKPVLIPHHKGRKRMHLEIRESITKMGVELKNKLLETLKFTWSHINMFTKGGNISTEAVEAEVDKLVRQQLEKEYEDDNQGFSAESFADCSFVGHLNNGRRIDYVLQEKPIEALNEYIFALTSHATYWNSEDTVLMILKEVYRVQGIFPKHDESRESLTQDYLHSQMSTSMHPSVSEINTFMTSNALLDENDILSRSTSFSTRAVDSTQAVNLNLPFISLDSKNTAPSSVTLGPPPLSGFVRKSPFGKP